MSGPNAVWPDGAREAVDAAHATWIGLHAWDDRTIDDLVLTALEPFVQQRIAEATRALDDDCRSLRDLQSWVADAVGLAPYMGCYVQDDVLPSVRRVVIERDSLRAEVARLREDGARVKQQLNDVLVSWHCATEDVRRLEREIDAARSAPGGEG